MNLQACLKWVEEFGITVLDPSKRLFWGNILGALVLLVLIPGRDRKGRWQILFSKRIWLHPSSKADMKIILVNTLLRTLLLPTSIFTSTGIAAGISLGLTYIFGGKPSLAIPPGVTSLAFTLTIFLADDFARFYLHYLQHRWPLLWAFHQTHHSALVLTPLTLLRTHPVEIITARLRTSLTYGCVVGIFFYALGETVTAWDILGTEVIGFTFNFLGANLRHSQVWVHFGPLERLLISPAAHQVHHSTHEAHYDKNFGVCLAVWDRLFRTHFDPRQIQEPLQYGLLGSPLSEPRQALWTLYAQPFKDFYRRFRGL
jgi:sterol desaturase/sphingolipid hydroxylase (fatty acid hydroxylase superfamily)